MRLLLVSEHLPQQEGTASGRVFRAAAQGLIDAGYEVTAVCWTEDRPTEDLPPWAEHRPLHRPHGLRDHAFAVLKPRWASSALGLDGTGFDVSLAEDPLSWAAIDGHRRTAVVVHYSCLLDARALGRVTPSAVQGHRSDRRAVRRASVPLTYSTRVGAALGGATWVPCAVELPVDPVPPVEAPRALLLAHWGWPPNAAALTTLLAEWPAVRRSVPGAELLLAGRGLGDVRADGVRVLGTVDRAVDAFAEAAVLAYPSPPTSGPKTKTLEALAAGLPVVTTEAGAEGLADPSVCATTPGAQGFSALLASVLGDPERRASMASRGRALVGTAHSPAAAAAARVAALSR